MGECGVLPWVEGEPPAGVNGGDGFVQRLKIFHAAIEQRETERAIGRALHGDRADRTASRAEDEDARVAQFHAKLFAHGASKAGAVVAAMQGADLSFSSSSSRHFRKR